MIMVGSREKVYNYYFNKKVTKSAENRVFKRLAIEIFLSVQPEEHDVAVGTQHDENVPERVQKHDL